MKIEKTNAIRIVEQNKVEYETHEYPHHDNDFVSGEEIYKLLNQDPNKVFKTIVLVSNNKYFTCMIPVLEEIDLKKAAKEFGQKSLELSPVNNLKNITGYIRGGCSPIGMKKLFPTIVDSSASNFESIIFSGGRIGLQLELKLSDLLKITNGKLKDIKRC